MKKLLTLALAFSMVFSLGMTSFGATTPVPGNPEWDVKYAGAKELKGEPWDRGNADGDKISSNANSAAFPGLYFYWNDKQKDNGVLLVDESVFDFFTDGKFKLTVKNANMYYGYEILPEAAYLIDGVYAYGIPKEIQFVGKNGKNEKDTLKNINMVFIDGNYKGATVELEKLWKIKGEVEPVKDEVLNELVTFTGLMLGVNEIKFKSYTEAVYGKKVTVAELASEAFSFYSGMLDNNPFNVTTVTDRLTGEVLRYEYSFNAMQEGNYKVTFVNEEVIVPQYARIIVKAKWLDVEGNPTEAPNHGFDEIFFGDIGVVEIHPVLGVFVDPDLFDLLIRNEYEINAKAYSKGGVNYEPDNPVNPAEVFIYDAEANRVYVVVFTFQAPEQVTKEDVSKFDKIPSFSQQHSNKWADIGIPTCGFGSMGDKDKGHGHIKFNSDFFDNYKSVTINFKISGEETHVTFTADGVEAIHQGWFERDDNENEYIKYDFIFSGGGYAEIVELLKWRVWID